MVGQLRKEASNWWTAHFKKLRRNGLYCDTNAVHVDCHLFCYMAVTKKELQTVACLCNLNRNISSKNTGSPSGRPYLLYHHPERNGTINCMHFVDTNKLDFAREMCCGDLPSCLSPEVNTLTELVI